MPASDEKGQGDVGSRIHPLCHGRDRCPMTLSQPEQPTRAANPSRPEPHRLCEACAQRGLREMLTQELRGEGSSGLQKKDGKRIKKGAKHTSGSNEQRKTDVIHS